MRVEDRGVPQRQFGVQSENIRYAPGPDHRGGMDPVLANELRDEYPLQTQFSKAAPQIVIFETVVVGEDNAAAEG